MDPLPCLRRGVLDARRRPSRLYFSQFATRTVDSTVDLYAAKPDIRPESRFLPTPPAFDALVRAFPVEKLECCGYPMVKKFRRYVYLFWHDPRTWQTDGRTNRQTDRQTPHDGIPALMHSIAWQKLLRIIRNETERHAEPGFITKCLVLCLDFYNAYGCYIIYTSLFHQRNGSSKQTYNIINKENTISKYKVNMTIISIVKNMTIKLQSILKIFTSSSQLINFSFFCTNFLVRLAKRTLGSSKSNMCWQVLTMLISEVFSNFMNSIFTTKSSELISRFLSGH